MNIFDDTTHKILMKFLNKQMKDAEAEIASTGILSEKHAISLILKSQFNHIARLETELTEVRKMMRQIGTGLTIGFTVPAFLIVLFGFLK